MEAVRTPVLIVGGGVAGLSCSIMLGELGVESLVVERRAKTSTIPKAHIIHARTLEILEQFGLEDTVRREACPPENFTHTSWYTSLGGDEPWDRQLIMSLPAWSYSTLEPYYREITASLMANLPQDRLEPILRARAEEINGVDHIRFGHELIDLVEETSGVVTATIVERISGSSYRVQATYVIGADGGNAVSQLVGVDMEGPQPFVDVMSLTFDTDLSPYLQEDHSLIRLFLQPRLDGTVRRFSIVAAGPDSWGRDCRRWRSGVILPLLQESQKYTDDDAIRDLRDLFKLPDLEISNITKNHWLIESVIAERFSVGRVFLVGDAAHRHSPMGGLGLNTGIQDAHNLTWKLAAVLKDGASQRLLDSYHFERYPVAKRRIEFATFSFFNHISVGGGFGLLPGASAEHNRSVLVALFSATPDGETRRSQLMEMIYTLRREFQHADIDLGYDYAGSAVVVADGTDPPAHDPVGHRYEPVARPGHRLPHTWFDRDGGRIASHHLLRPGTFLMLTGERGKPWYDAAVRFGREFDVAVDAYQVGPNGQLRATDRRWAVLRGHDEFGAVLIRPDGHVAFRALTRAGQPDETLRDAFRVALGGRTVAASNPARSS